ncbi:MAG: glycosyltransferase [Thermodesulfobacteriota bacterium]
MDISIVICTKNRSEKLSRCLDVINNLESQNLNVELVIVDNNSSDNTQQIIINFSQKSRFALKSVIEKNKGSGYSRNKGILNSKGKIIVMVDDDCYLEKNYLQITSSQFKDSRVGFVAGRILLYDETDSRMTTLYDENKKEFNELQLIQPGRILGANLCFRKDALFSVNCFDTMLGTGTKFAAEDIDCAYRILSKGWKGLYEPELIVYHHHGRKNPVDTEKLVIFYDRGTGVYFLKCFLNPLFNIWIKLSVIKCFLFKKNIKRHHAVQGAFEYIYEWILKSFKAHF